MQWPSENLAQAANLGGRELKHKRAGFLNSGIGVTTAYSGIGTAEIAAEALWLSYSQVKGDWEGGETVSTPHGPSQSSSAAAPQGRGFVYVESVDLKGSAQSALLSHHLSRAWW